MNKKSYLIVLLMILRVSSLFSQQLAFHSDEHDIRVSWINKELVLSDKIGKVIAISDFGGAVANAKVIVSNSPLGVYEAIELELENKNSIRAFCLPGYPFMAIQPIIKNTGELTAVIENFIPFRFNSGSGYRKLFTLEGLTPSPGNKEVYQFMSLLGKKETLFTGWLTSLHGSGIVKAFELSDEVQVEPCTEYGALRIPPGESYEGEIFLVGEFDDPYLAHETYAEALAAWHRISLKPIPKGGHCTWQAGVNGKAGTEEGTRALAEYCAENLVDFGFELIQLDDDWQNGPDRKHLQRWRPRSDFSTHRKDGPYPNGMKKTAGDITSNGMVAGLWLMPFAWDANCDLLKTRQELFAKDTLGNVRNVEWAGECLDMTNPLAKDLVYEAVSRITRQWGYKYIKTDALFTGLAADHIPRTHPRYTPDRFGKTIFYDPAKTPVDAFREGLQVVRNAAGNETYILGCSLIQNYRMLGTAIGLVDGMRIGPDVTTSWRILMRGIIMPTRLYFFHNRVWHNDPDHLMLREPLTYVQARSMATWIALSGQLNLSGENLLSIGEDRVNLYKRSIPNTGLTGKPVDLFTSEQPQIWCMPVEKPFAGLYALGLFNWSEEEKETVQVSMEQLGLNKNDNYLVFDFWNQALVEVKNGKVQVNLNPCDSRVMVIRKSENRPMFIGSNRHIIQGSVDLVDEKWLPQEKKLIVTCQLTANDPYQLQIYLPSNSSGFKPKAVYADGNKTDNYKQTENICTINCKRNENTTVQFKLIF